jgi:hypothetical protein
MRPPLHRLASRLENRLGHDGESGAVLVVVALTLVMLMGFAAFAVDVGNQYAHRRQAQNTADAAALAAAVELSLPGGSAQDALDQAISFVDQNTSISISTSDWVNECNDPEPLAQTAADLSLIPATPCVSFGLNEVRVSLPIAEIDTYFAGVVGVDTLRVTAAANTHWKFPGHGNPPPFVATAGASGGDEVCLRTSPSATPIPMRWVGNGPGSGPLFEPTQTGPVDPCDDSLFATGSSFFGTLDPYVYAEKSPNPPAVECSRPGANVLDYSIAAGIDHTTGAFEPDYPGGVDLVTNPVMPDGTDCPNTVPNPNTFELQTGLTAQKLRCGLISTRNGTCSDGPDFDGEIATPRFQNGPYVQSTYDFSGEDMDNKPLWEFIRTDIDSVTVPQECRDARSRNGDPLYDYYDIKDLMVDCLTKWKNTPNRDYIFSVDIATSARFAFIPQVAESNLTTSPVHINNYVPAFLQKIYQEGKRTGNPDPFCWSTAESGGNPTGWYTHEAGQEFDCGRDNDTLDRVSALIIPCAALPASLCTDPNVPGGPGGTPTLTIELTK